MRSRILILVSALALAACSAPPPPAAPQAPPPAPVTVAPPPPARPAGDWTDWPLSAGDWVYRQDDRGSIALFGVAGADAQVTLRCDKARQRVYLARAGSGGGGIIIRSSSATKQFAGAATGGASPYVATEILPNDPILDAMIFSRGRIAIEAAGHMPIAIPSWAEIGRVVEDCRV
ncbi:MAG: hypothetical protein ABI668_09305 [Sphingorhabdus sp.]